MSRRNSRCLAACGHYQSFWPKFPGLILPTKSGHKSDATGFSETFLG
jgi:hypothetical protein